MLPDFDTGVPSLSIVILIEWANSKPFLGGVRRELRSAGCRRFFSHHHRRFAGRRWARAARSCSVAPAPMPLPGCAWLPNEWASPAGWARISTRCMAAGIRANGIDTAGLEIRGAHTPRSWVVYQREDARTETPQFGDGAFRHDMAPQLADLSAFLSARRAAWYAFCKMMTKRFW